MVCDSRPLKPKRLKTIHIQWAKFYVKVNNETQDVFQEKKEWRYTDNVLGRHILAERKVEIYHTKLDEFKAELERRNFHKRPTNLVDSSIDLALVKEFYANLYSPEGPSRKQVRIQGHLIRIDVDSLNAFLETPVVLAEGESLPVYSRYCRMPTNIREIEAALCIPGRGSRGVASDSLVFERLSPVINLAYIRKNCWSLDPNDPIIIIKGARRPRARPAEAPSTLAAPRPASTSAAPPSARITAVPYTLPPPDFQRFEAMLRSIHQWQIILLQSLQLVVPPDSIPTVEQFNEWVAWPGTQPPLHREDEDPATQVPHQPKDESSESSTLEPLIRKKRIVVTQEAATTSEKSLEATPELLAPTVDSTSPQQVADPSMPEDQNNLALSPNTSPVATPVLHLSKEEEGQTHNTQDQSQDL
ncbi:hypothetical protein HKD37_08G022905 [Glycine soja]